MPLSYSYEVSNYRIFGLLRLWFKWGGSIWKVLFLDLLVYIFLYIVIRLIKQFALPTSAQNWFHDVSNLWICEGFSLWRYLWNSFQFAVALQQNIESIPMAFLLGFFVSQVYDRWINVYASIPWPFPLVDRLCLALKTSESNHRSAGESHNKHAKLLVQTVSRYMHLCLAMAMRDICYQFRQLMVSRNLTFIDMGKWNSLTKLTEVSWQQKYQIYT